MVYPLSIIGRTEPLLAKDMLTHEKELSRLVSSSRFLVIGGAGSIGSAVSLEIFRRNPKLLHIVDINENNTVELVRNIRSSLGYGDGEFETFVIDCGSDIFNAFMEQGQGYDYVLNLSALKHVRSEKDPYTLMRMIEVNILNTDKIMGQAKNRGAGKYFCVSTDKAANPVNMMGASKKIMEMFLMRRSTELAVSTARFANVAFSDGSLLFGFNRRMEQGQPLSAPYDVKRYFITPDESGELCLMSCLLGENRDIFFPKPDHDLNSVTFSEIAVRYLEFKGYEAVQCATEEEARGRVRELAGRKKYPVYFFKSDTTGEKDFEEFYTDGETLDMDRYIALGVIKNEAVYDVLKLRYFQDTIAKLRNKGIWTRLELIDLFNEVIPEFDHKETGKFLDKRM
jgi:FlaA1/EpsC-like NDP-sugar epimerase